MNSLPPDTAKASHCSGSINAIGTSLPDANASQATRLHFALQVG